MYCAYRERDIKMSKKKTSENLQTNLSMKYGNATHKKSKTNILSNNITAVRLLLCMQDTWQLKVPFES